MQAGTPRFTASQVGRALRVEGQTLRPRKVPAATLLQDSLGAGCGELRRLRQACWPRLLGFRLSLAPPPLSR